MRRTTLAVSVVVLLPFFLPHSLSAKSKSQYEVGSYAKYVEIAGATRVGSDACVKCHTDINGNFRHAFHAQQGIECEDCHGPASLHVEGGGDVAKIISFRSRPAEESDGVCLSCHVQDEKVRNWFAGRHPADGVRCIDCHQVHVRALRAGNESQISLDTATQGAFVAASVSPETNVILRPRSATNDACLKCHQTEHSLALRGLSAGAGSSHARTLVLRRAAGPDSPSSHLSFFAGDVRAGACAGGASIDLLAMGAM